MKARNISYRFAAVLTFGIGLMSFLLWSGLSRSENSQAERSKVIGVLTPAPVMDYYREQTETSDQLMVIAQPASTSISEPVNLSFGNEDLIEGNCATLTISIDDNHQVKLNGEEMGTLENFQEVATTLKGFFDDRTRMRVFSMSMQSRSDLSDEERAYKTVLINPSPSLTFAEVTRVIGMVKQTGARPIAVRTRYLEP